MSGKASPLSENEIATGSNFQVQFSAAKLSELTRIPAGHARLSRRVLCFRLGFFPRHSPVTLGSRRVSRDLRIDSCNQFSQVPEQPKTMPEQHKIGMAWYGISITGTMLPLGVTVTPPSSA